VIKHKVVPVPKHHIMKAYRGLGSKAPYTFLNLALNLNMLHI